MKKQKKKIEAKTATTRSVRLEHKRLGHTTIHHIFGMFILMKSPQQESQFNAVSSADTNLSEL